MTSIPGIAVPLLGLLPVLVAFALIQLTRYLLRPLLYSLASIFRVIPLVGGFLSKETLKIERIVDSWLASAALATEKIAYQFFAGLVVLFARLGRELSGLALDVYHLGDTLLRVTLPRLLGQLRVELLRLLRAAEAQVLRLEHRLASGLGYVERRIASLARTIGRDALAAVREAERFALKEIRAAAAELRSLLGAALRLLKALEYRLGRLEASVFNDLWKLVRELERDLNPVTLFRWVLGEVERLAGPQAWRVLRLVWRLFTGYLHLLEEVFIGDFPPSLGLPGIRRVLERTPGESQWMLRAFRRELGL